MGWCRNRLSDVRTAAAASPARAVVLALLGGYALAALLAVATHWHMDDAGSYWNAAMRLREGGSLYFSSQDPSDATLYWYAPWFALVWVPLTWLPHGLVIAGWATVLVGSLAYLLWPRTRTPAAIAISLLLFPDLLRSVSTGNVQVGMLALVAWGLSRRSGPVAIALAASLKVFPLLLAIILVGRRRWWAAAACLTLTGILVAPILAFDLSGYPQRQITAPLPLPLMFALAFVALLVAVSSKRYRNLGAAILVMFANPSWAPGTSGFLALPLTQPKDD
jgi:Glycosyltransferase family 87